MVSVVIPTYNAADYLPKLLSALRQQTIFVELIIIDSGSTDNTQSILKEQGIQYKSIKKSSFNHGATRNYGITLASHELVIFLTQDAIPASDRTFELLVNSLSESTIAMGYGRQLPYPDTDIFGKFARYTNYPDKSIIKNKSMIPLLGIKTCSSSNSFAIYRKSLLINIGSFPKDTILGEDVTVAAKFILEGYSVAYCAEAQVFHSHSYSIHDEFKRYFDIGVFHYQQRDVLRSFTTAEAQGFRYALEEIKYFVKNGAIIWLPVQFIRTIAKYLGYKAGRSYRKLPRQLNRILSMHKSFWE